MASRKNKPDAMLLEVFKNIFHSIAEEMGAALRRSAFSPNIKERRDYSCAVYNANGEVLAMGDHMPVHLGSMPASVAAARHSLSFSPGDIALLNDPFAGGTHLPDLTLVAPVFLPRENFPHFFVASRAHHADIGGALAGSMGPAREIYQEGLRIPPVKIFRNGKPDNDVLRLLLANVRTPLEREGDLGAQIASCRLGERRLQKIVTKYGVRMTDVYATHLLDYSEKVMRAELFSLKPGKYRAEDFLDSDGAGSRPLRIRVTIQVAHSSAVVDFTGSAPQCAGNLNAVEAIAVSAVYYVFRSLLSEDVPATSGLLRPLTVIAPSGTIVNAVPPAAVAGGNVETSQRIVDTLLRALAKAAPHRIPAASQGTMNNLTFGGFDPRRANRPFTYYETIAGGCGASPLHDGPSAAHSHLTNSWNTPTEVFEEAYPARVNRYAIRHGSGGAGRHRGGDGIIRELEFRAAVEVGLLTDRRSTAPYSLHGGQPGSPGKNTLKAGASVKTLAAKSAFRASPGDTLRIETPGGGGWGTPSPRKNNRANRRKRSRHDS
ncbi:MAG TPA: hydantoinase B/oxoprolinase family protein [Candidatus Eisenbacteria bacterium]|jgi:N-methylhydantoinase B|nr:hydantoinase B/oxoprolinase family protein [Candidatus Eisenbacteria bacterium]